VEGKDIPFHPFVLELYLASISFNGSTITWPDSRASGYAATILTAIQAICAGALTKSGGSQALTAALNLGATYGVTAASFTALGTSALTTLNSTTVNAAVVNATTVAAQNVGACLVNFAGTALGVGAGDKFLRLAGGLGTIDTTEATWLCPFDAKFRAISVSFGEAPGGCAVTVSVRAGGVEIYSLVVDEGVASSYDFGFGPFDLDPGEEVSVQLIPSGTLNAPISETHVSLVLSTA
jgi:hypothetical protein